MAGDELSGVDCNGDSDQVSDYISNGDCYGSVMG